jgi:hypothetical protein
VGIRLSFSCPGIQDSLFWVLTKGPVKEPLSPGVTRKVLSQSRTLEPFHGAHAMGEGQAWGPGSHLPSACKMVSSAPLPPIPSPVSGFLSVCSPQGGEGWLISAVVWGRAPRPLGALRSGPRGLGVISPARSEGNPTLEPGTQGLLPSALQHQVRAQTFILALIRAPSFWA